MITLQKPPGTRMLEIGGGENPNPASDVNIDVRPIDGKVHFTVDFEKFPWPIGDSDFEYIYSQFCMEHISWRNSEAFVRELFRIVKPGGKIVLVIPNTEAQIKYILSKPEPDGDEGSMLFGDLNYPENGHKSYWCPRSTVKLFSKVGFENIKIQPFGQLATDMVVEADKPKATVRSEPKMLQSYINNAGLDSVSRAALFDRKYFNGEVIKPFYWDVPTYEIVYRKVMALNPQSVLELGCGRGYVLKRIMSDPTMKGKYIEGLDISKHCQLSKVTPHIIRQDVLDGSGFCPDGLVDVCFSQNFLEYVPEGLIPNLCERIARASSRGLHGVCLEGEDDGSDNRRCTIRTKQWWEERLPKGHTVLSKQELENGPFPDEVRNGDGRTKLNIGCAWTQFHWGWTNIDIVDTVGFSNAYGYKYLQWDVTKGLPQYGTGVVDMIYAAHFLEHLTYDQGLTFLRECRRVIRPDGVLRILVPCLSKLTNLYVNRPDDLAQFDELNEGCSKSEYNSRKLWELLMEGHKSIYGAGYLQHVLSESGWNSKVVDQCKGHPQMIRETLDVLPSISLIVEATPMVG